MSTDRERSGIAPPYRPMSLENLRFRHPSTKAPRLPGCRHRDRYQPRGSRPLCVRWSAVAGRRRGRDAGVRPSQLQGDPSRASEAELRGLRPDRAGTGAIAAHRSRTRRTGIAGACAGVEVCRSHAALSAVGDLCPRRRRSGPLHAGRMGRSNAASCSLRWSKPCAIMFSRQASCMPTTRPVPVLAPGNGKTKTGRLWTYVRDDRPSGRPMLPPSGSPTRPTARESSHANTSSSIEGALQADAYAGFHHLYEGGTIFEVACWAHARRKFHEIHLAHASPTTSEAIERIAALYAIEDEIRGSTPEVSEDRPSG